MKRVSLLLLLVACPFVVGLRAQDPVPEFYGVYALENGKLTEFQENANLNDFGPAVRIIVFGKGLWGPASGLFFLPPSKPKAADDGQFKGWDDFWKQSQEFGKAMDKAMGVRAKIVSQQ